MKSPDGIVRQLGCQIDRELDRFAGQVHTFAPFTRHVLDACVPGAWPETRTLSSAATWMKSRLSVQVICVVHPLGFCRFGAEAISWSIHGPITVTVGS